MLQSFEKWRSNVMGSFDPHSLAHYHRVHDAIWHDVKLLLRRLCVARVNAGQDKLSFVLTADQAEILLHFLREMDLFYIHPRSSSAKFYFAAKNQLLNPLT